MKVISKMLSSSHNNKYYHPTTITFWDFETCPVEKNQIRKFVDLVRLNYRNFAFDGYHHFVLYNSNVDNATIAALEQKLRITVVNCSPGYKTKYFNAEIRKMINSLTYLVLITDDDCFINIIDELSNKISLIHGKQFNLNNILKHLNLQTQEFEQFCEFQSIKFIPIQKETKFDIENCSHKIDTAEKVGDEYYKHLAYSDRSLSIKCNTSREDNSLMRFDDVEAQSGRNKLDTIGKSEEKYPLTSHFEINSQDMRKNEVQSSHIKNMEKNKNLIQLEDEEIPTSGAIAKSDDYPANKNFENNSLVSHQAQINNRNYYRGYSMTRMVESNSKLCGLKNLGNTCYINSAIQCLFSIELLTKFAIEFYKEPIYKYKEDTLFATYARLVYEMCKGTNKVVSPKEIKFNISEYSDEFKGSQQKDCSEFLATVLNRFDEELSSIPPQKIGSNNHLIISSLFKGIQKFYWTCNRNHRMNESTMPFYILNLPQLEQEYYQAIPIEISLRKYFSSRSVEADVECEICNEIFRPKEQIEIVQLPKILILQLKTNPLLSYYQSRFQIPEYLFTDKFLKGVTPYTYRLFAVSNYIGNAYSGHYTAFAKCFADNKWYEFDDTMISELRDYHQFVNNTSSKAYLLFYKKL